MRHLSKWISVAVMTAGMALAGTLSASAAPAHHPSGPGHHPPRVVCVWEKIHRHHHHAEWVLVCHQVRHH